MDANDPNDLDALRRAPQKNDSELDIKKRREHRYRRLKPGEIPPFKSEQSIHEDDHTMESTTTEETIVTQDGQLITSPDDIKGVCYMALTGKSSSCGVLTKKRRCCEPNCDRLMCTAHSNPHPTEKGQYFCEEHWKEFQHEQLVENLGAVLFAIFAIVLTVVWATLTLCPFLVPCSLVCRSLQPVRWLWARYPWKT